MIKNSFLFTIMLFAFYSCKQSLSESKFTKEYDTLQREVDTLIAEKKVENVVALLDTQLYDKKIAYLSHDTITSKWPPKTPYPLPGAILPFNRIVAYYGNLYTSGMGILGQKPSEQMLEKLKSEVEYWKKEDTTTNAIPALHYIAVTAQKSPGKGGKYRLRMPDTQIDKVLEMAKSIDAITILDVQVGHSTLQNEIPELQKYLLMPDVHLGIDPEWAMNTGHVPGKKIGSMNADDINYCIEYLAELVRKNNLPPKILVIHRFTRGMVTNYNKIKTCPEVQIVISMDGFGFPAKKINSYKNAITREPIQFSGFKLFYKNDIKSPPHRLMTAREILDLHPRPIYIQYQ